MKTLSYSNKSRVLVIGSIHGHYADFADEVVADNHNTLFISVGSSYLGYGSIIRQDLELEYLQQICAKTDNVVLIVRGADDNPLYFKEDFFKEHKKGLSDILKNVIFLEDYDVVKTKFGDFLCIGGAPHKSESFTMPLRDPKEYFNENTPHDIKFKDTDVTIVDPFPKYETVEGSENEVDTNPFTSFLADKNINYVVSSLSILSTTKKDNMINDTAFLSAVYFNTLNKGKNIKYWFFEGSYMMCEEVLVEGTTFKPLKEYNDYVVI